MAIGGGGGGGHSCRLCVFLCGMLVISVCGDGIHNGYNALHLKGTVKQHNIHAGLFGVGVVHLLALQSRSYLHVVSYA